MKNNSNATRIYSRPSKSYYFKSVDNVEVYFGTREDGDNNADLTMKILMINKKPYQKK